MLKNALVIALALGAAALIAWTARGKLRFHRDYAFTGAFAGRRYECRVGGLAGEHTMLCLVGADRDAFFILAHPKQRSWLLKDGQDVFKRSLRIPWDDFVRTLGTVPLNRKIMWFRFERRRIYVYVPRDIGMALLADAGRPAPLAP